MSDESIIFLVGILGIVLGYILGAFVGFRRGMRVGAWVILSSLPEALAQQVRKYVGSAAKEEIYGNQDSRSGS